MFFLFKNFIIVIQNWSIISRYYLLFYSIIQNWFILQLVLYIILEGVKYPLFLKVCTFYIEIICSMSHDFQLFQNWKVFEKSVTHQLIISIKNLKAMK